MAPAKNRSVLDYDSEEALRKALMMMPPPEIYSLEQYLTKYLSTMDTLKLNDEGDELIMLGSGRIVCQNVAKAAV